MLHCIIFINIFLYCALLLCNGRALYWLCLYVNYTQCTSVCMLGQFFVLFLSYNILSHNQQIRGFFNLFNKGM